MLSDLLILGGCGVGLGFVVYGVYRMCAPPPPEETYWRYIPRWKPERIEKLWVIDPDEHELARKAQHTLLKQEQDRRG